MGRIRRREAWPGTHEHAIQWLRDRGGAADDELTDRDSFFDLVLMARHFGLFDSMLWQRLPLPVFDMWALRRARTNRARIGSLAADQARGRDYEGVWWPLGFRLVCIAVVVGGGVTVDAGWVQVALLALMVPFIGALTSIGVLLAIGAAAAGLDSWWYCLFCLGSTTAVVYAATMRGLVRRTWDDVGPYLGFLPLHVVSVLLIRRKLSLLATAVDVSEADNADLTAVFVDACAGSSAETGPIIDMCRASAALQNGEMDEAIAVGARARAAAALGRPRIRGWCALRIATILMSSGRGDDARAALAEAVGLLRGWRVRRWRRRAELRLLELDIERANGDLVDLLRRVHRLRLTAVRRHDDLLLDRTEFWLARLMLIHGSADGVRWTLDHIVSGSDGRTESGRSREETAANLILRARVNLPKAESAEQVLADATAALALVDATRRPLAAVNARLVLARLREGQAQLEEAMAHAAEALVVANRARYQLPSSQWRADWSVRQLDVFATALELADRLGDSVLVAEIIEMARGEVLPAGSSASDAGLLSMLDVFHERVVVAGASDLSASTEESDAGFAMAGLSPVSRPPVARIAGSRTLSESEPDVETFDLERELVATAGRCWYWSGATVADRYYWAVRSPEGQWSHGWVDQGADSFAARALAALDLALPIPRLGETDADRLARVLDGPLGRPVRADREVELLAMVGDAFLPIALSRGLAREQPPGRKLVVSLSATLNQIPVAWLPLSRDPDTRVVERVAVVHVPAWAVLTRCRSRARGGLRAKWPIRLALINPGHSSDVEVMGSPPPDAQCATAGPMSKSDVRNALKSVSDSRDWLLYLVGHVVSEPGNTSLHGLKVAGGSLNGVLTIRDLVATDSESSPRYPIPARVIAVGCDSMGMSSAAVSRHGGALANEWLGFSAAVMFAGADHICCTAYPVFENNALRAIAYTLAESLAREPDACLAVAGVQRRLLRRWRSTQRGLPVLRQSFVYIGRG